MTGVNLRNSGNGLQTANRLGVNLDLWMAVTVGAEITPALELREGTPMRRDRWTLAAAGFLAITLVFSISSVRSAANHLRHSAFDRRVTSRYKTNTKFY